MLSDVLSAVEGAAWRQAGRPTPNPSTDALLQSSATGTQSVDGAETGAKAAEASKTDGSSSATKTKGKGKAGKGVVLASLNASGKLARSGAVPLMGPELPGRRRKGPIKPKASGDSAETEGADDTGFGEQPTALAQALLSEARLSARRRSLSLTTTGVDTIRGLLSAARDAFSAVSRRAAASAAGRGAGPASPFPAQQTMARVQQSSSSSAQGSQRPPSRPSSASRPSIDLSTQQQQQQAQPAPNTPGSPKHAPQLAPSQQQLQQQEQRKQQLDPARPTSARSQKARHGGAANQDRAVAAFPEAAPTALGPIGSIQEADEPESPGGSRRSQTVLTEQREEDEEEEPGAPDHRTASASGMALGGITEDDDEESSRPRFDTPANDPHFVDVRVVGGEQDGTPSDATTAAAAADAGTNAAIGSVEREFTDVMVVRRKSVDVSQQQPTSLTLEQVLAQALVSC